MINQAVAYSDLRVRLILLSGFLGQLISCFTATGFYHPDSHFSVVEFSSYQLNEANSASAVWEFDHYVRQTIQVYLLSGYRLAMKTIGISNGYDQLTILRVIQGLSVWGLFNAIAIFYFRSHQRMVFYTVLLLLNFSWFYPYVRTLFCSEILSSFFFFGALFIYDRKRNNHAGWKFLSFIGFLFGLAFFSRFQMGFGIAGFGLWMLFFEKKYKRILPLAIGFLICSALNIWLDTQHYREFVVIPYNYFHANIVEGRAASFGTSSFLRYIGLLVATLGAPPFSFVFFYYGLRGCLAKLKHPFVLSTLTFIVAHCVVGHKEERFLFPIFNILPVIVGWGLPYFLSFFQQTKRWIRVILKFLLILSTAINFFVLAAITFTPYSQTVHFTEKLQDYFQGKAAILYCLDRTPFETISKVPMTFYRREHRNVNLIRVNSIDSIVVSQPAYFTSTFNQIRDYRNLLDSAGYTPVLYSSRMLWNIDNFLYRQGLPPIDDIWVLYRK